MPRLTAELFDKVSLEKYKQAYQTLFSDAAKTKVFITGDVKIEEIKPLLEKYIGSLPIKSKEGFMWKDENKDIMKGTRENIFSVPMTAPKATVALIYSGDIKYSREQAIVASALNYILDMTYTKTIREDEGGTYGVGVSVDLTDRPKDGVVMMINFDTDPAKAEKLVSIAIDGLNKIAEEGVSEEYILKAKENFLKSFPERQISNSYWMGIVSRYYTLGQDFYENYVPTIEKCVNEWERISMFIEITKIKHYIVRDFSSPGRACD